MKDWANVCKTCICGDKLRKQLCFVSYTAPFKFTEFINHFFGLSIIVPKKFSSREQALIKTNRKPSQNHQSKTMLLFKMYTLEFEFDKHLEHMVSYQRMLSWLPVFLVGKFGTFEFDAKMTVW